MIKEAYCSFEVAKLLKEKGFDEPTFHDYNEKGIRWFEEVLVKHNSQGGIACPTLQMAMAWLREVRHLEIYPTHDNFQEHHNWWFGIYRAFKGYSDFLYESDSIYPTYEEAVEAALKYCLQNLI